MTNRLLALLWAAAWLLVTLALACWLGRWEIWPLSAGLALAILAALLTWDAAAELARKPPAPPAKP